MIDVMSVWHGFGPETKAAIIGGISTIIAATAGAAVVMYQIGSQAKSTNKSLLESEVLRLKTEFYADVQKVCADYVEIASQYTGKIVLAGQQILIAARSKADDKPYNDPKARVAEIQALHYALNTAVLNVVFLIERRQFIEPRILVFRSALSSAFHDVGTVFTEKLFIALMHTLPTDRPAGGVFEYSPPDAVTAEAIWHEILGHIDAVGLITAYVADFVVEMQNLMMEPLFKKRVPHRVPIDPGCKVITVANADGLEDHFRTQTTWGQIILQQEEEARQKFAAVNKGKK